MTIGYVETISLTTGGTGYSVENNVPTTTTGSGTGLTIDILTVSSGAISTFSINTRGSGYKKNDTITIIQTGSNDDANFNIDSATYYHQIVYTISEGGIGKGNVTQKRLDRLGGMTATLATYPQPAIEFPHIDLPSNKQFTDSWEISGNTVVENFTTAKTNWLSKLRTQRDYLLEETDKYAVEAASQYKVLTTIQARQQYLRDLTDDADIDAATTTDDLAAITIDSWSPPTVKNLNSINKFFRTDVTSATYTITGGDEFIGVTHTSTAAVTLTLPEISTIEQMKYCIKDEGGNAATNNITINRSGTDTIDGQTSATINTDYGVINLYHDSGTGWYIY